jgi:Intron-binding protein aquarius N-terminal
MATASASAAAQAQAPAASVHKKQPRAHHAPTVKQILGNKLTQLSLQHWAGENHASGPAAYDAQLVECIYTEHMCARGFDSQAVVLLELSRYLECYLWPHLPEWSSSSSSSSAATATAASSAEVSRAHMLSIVVMINEKFRQKVPAWECFRAHGDRFAVLFQKILRLAFSPVASSSSAHNKEAVSSVSCGKAFEGFSSAERAAFVLFLVNCFQSFEETLVRPHCLQLVGLRTWHHLPVSALQRECAQMPKLAALWQRICTQEQQQQQHEQATTEGGTPAAGKRARTSKQKKKKKSSKKSKRAAKKAPALSFALQSDFLVKLCEEFLRTLYSSSFLDSATEQSNDDEVDCMLFSMVVLFVSVCVGVCIYIYIYVCVSGMYVCMCMCVCAHGIPGCVLLLLFFDFFFVT